VDPNARLTYAQMMSADPNDPGHGTKTGYDKHKCRCTKCRAANAAWMKSYRIRLADMAEVKRLEQAA